jgi:hypothetical protein
MNSHRHRSGLDRPSGSFFMPKPVRTAGMRAKTDAPLQPLYRAGFFGWLKGR